MVMARHSWCHVCRRDTLHHNGWCCHCEKLKEEAKVRAWESMSIEDKLTDLCKRIENLERGPARY
jgi:hypothetical protein